MGDYIQTIGSDDAGLTQEQTDKLANTPTDTNAELADKAATNAVVDLTTTQNIAGNKNFAGSTSFTQAVQANNNVIVESRLYAKGPILNAAYDWGTVGQIITSQGSINWTWEDIPADTTKADKLSTIIAKTASFTFALTDVSNSVQVNSASDLTATVPLNSSVAFDIGSVIFISRLGTGAVTFVATGGVTIRSKDGNLAIDGQYAEVSIRKIATDEWILIGALA